MYNHCPATTPFTNYHGIDKHSAGSRTTYRFLNNNNKCPCLLFKLSKPQYDYRYSVNE